jgi:D-alanyl-D-alanine carboxypeptidase (penicillin-binding protein 5/6)
MPVLYCILFLISTINILGSEPSTQQPAIEAQAAVLMDVDSGILLYAKNENQKLYPASVTKIMTALLTLEANEKNLDKRVPFSHDAVFSLPYDASNIAMNEGESLSVGEALYGLMLASANEVANALAESVGGSQTAFVERMNQKADALGAVSTHFVNPNGLHDENHYTCAYDMALFMREAVSDARFLDIISTKHIDLPPTEKQSESRPLNNSNKLIQPTSNYYNPDVVGGKTGYTSQAMHTLVNYALKDGIRLVSVVLYDGKNQNYADTNALLQYGFSHYHEAKIFDRTRLRATADVITDDTGSVQTITLSAKEDLLGQYPLEVTAESVEQKLNLPAKIEAPVKAGDKVGTLTLEYQENVLGEISLFANESAQQADAAIAVFSAEQTALPPTQREKDSGGFTFNFGLQILAGLAALVANQAASLSFGAGIIVLLLAFALGANQWRLRRKDPEKELLRYINRGRKKIRF